MTRFKFILFLIFLFLGILVLLFFNIFFSSPKYIETEFVVIDNTYIIKGNSMLPTLKDRQKVNVFFTDNFTRSDIVIFKFKTSNITYVKRVIAIENDKILFLENSINLNGKILKEDYIIEDNSLKIIEKLQKQLEYYNNTIPKSYVLVLGDNRKESYDSGEYGLIPKEYILGKIIQ